MITLKGTRQRLEPSRGPSTHKQPRAKRNKSPALCDDKVMCNVRKKGSGRIMITVSRMILGISVPRK